MTERARVLPIMWSDGGGALRQAMRIVADGLTGRGFDVRGPAWEDCERLAITNVRGAFCELSIYGGGRVTWEYQPLQGHDAGSVEVTRIVMRLLGAGDPGHVASGPAAAMAVPLTRVVAIALTDRGLDVYPANYMDQLSGGIFADIEVTNPVRRERGKVQVTAEGAIMWERSVRCGTGREISNIADAIAAALAASGSAD